MTDQSYPKIGLFDMKHASLSQISINIDHLLVLSIIITATLVLHQIDVSGIYEFDEKYILDFHDSLDPDKVNITIYEKEKENGWIDDGWKELGHLFIPFDENGIMQINVFDPHSMKKIFPDDAQSIDDTIGPDAFWAISHNDIAHKPYTDRSAFQACRYPCYQTVYEDRSSSCRLLASCFLLRNGSGSSF